MRTWALAVALLASASGCSGPRHLGWATGTGVAVATSAVAFTDGGHVTTLDGDAAVPLPRAQDDVVWGLVVVDVTPLPRAWRPPSAPDGGVIVAALDVASPLSIAGLAAGDLILTVNGGAARDTGDVLGTLRDVAAQDLPTPAIVTARRAGPPGRPPETIRIEAYPALRGVQRQTHLIFEPLFRAASTQDGTSVQIGPFYGGLFNMRHALLVEHERTPEGFRLPVSEPMRYVDRFDWSVLLHLVSWSSEHDRRTGEERGQLRLLWFFTFGDDVADTPIGICP